jgi:hypothetical protein
MTVPSISITSQRIPARDSEGRGLKSAARGRAAQLEQKDADSARRSAAGSAGYRVQEKWPMQNGGWEAGAAFPPGQMPAVSTTRVLTAPAVTARDRPRASRAETLACHAVCPTLIRGTCRANLSHASDKRQSAPCPE